MPASISDFSNSRFFTNQFAVVESLNHVQLFVTPWTAAHQAPLSFTILWSLLKFISTESMMLYNHLIPSIRVFLNELVLCIGGQNIGISASAWSFSPPNEYWFISFRFDLLAVQGTFKSLLQHHSSKASTLWRSDFFMVQLSYLYMTTGKTIASTV